MNFSKGVGENEIIFPITQSQIDNLKPCKIVNPFAMDNERVLIKEPIADVPQPGSAEFEAELVNVARAVHMAKNNERFDSTDSFGWELFTSKLEGKFLSTCLNKSFRVNEKYTVNYGVRTTKDLGLLVHSDYPTQLMDDLFRAMRTEGAKLDSTLFPETPYGVFTDGVVAAEHVIAKLVHEISPTAFAHKYHFGRPRPEEVIYAWAKGEFQVSEVTNEALEHYVNKEEVLEDARKFTLYKEGCPGHPALPAMHSAVAAMALTVATLLSLTDDQKKQCIKMAANIAFGRTFAGVHYRLDNTYGLELGERCAEIILPKIMKDLMGADEDKVKLKISQNRVNWLTA